MRRIRLIFTIVSATTCALAVVMWSRSHHAGEIIGREARDDTGYVATFHGVFSGGGQLALAVLRVEHRVGLPEDNAFEPRVPKTRSWRWRREFTPFPFLADAGAGAAGGAAERLEQLGFGSRGDDFGPDFRRHYRGVGVPYWLLVIVTAAPPVWLFASRVLHGVRRIERTTRGCCAQCGYDVRAATARCPECGTELAPRA